jgi:ATP-dependent helicase HrpA
MSPLRELEHSISLAMQADQFSLRKMMRAVKDSEKAGKPFDRLLEKLQGLLQKSLQRREQRAVWQPRLNWDEELPVVARKQEIIDTIRDHQVIVLCGETGSGKSTQLPKILIEMGRGLSGVIGHTQPRRIAARSVAARLAEEMNCQLGQEVGFRIRFTDSSGPNTRVRLMTDGILLAETQTDRFLDQYDTIIVDEAHERSLNIDFLLGYLKRLLPRRRDLKVIITSATIDAARFAAHFGTSAVVARSVSDREPAIAAKEENQPDRDRATLDGSRSGTDRATGGFASAPVLQISGRMYPVEIHYRPLDDPEAGMGEDDNRQPRDWLDGVTDAVEELTANDSGHILVFLPTERDIRETAKILGGRRYRGDTPRSCRFSDACRWPIRRKCFHRTVIVGSCWPRM